jgi:hypothetical protein
MEQYELQLWVALPAFTTALSACNDARSIPFAALYAYYSRHVSRFADLVRFRRSTGSSWGVPWSGFGTIHGGTRSPHACFPSFTSPLRVPRAKFSNLPFNNTLIDQSAEDREIDIVVRKC